MSWNTLRWMHARASRRQGWGIRFELTAQLCSRDAPCSRLGTGPVDTQNELVMQVNKVVHDGPTDYVRMQDGARFFVNSAMLRGWGGQADARVVNKTGPALVCCANAADVMTQHAAGTWKTVAAEPT